MVGGTETPGWSAFILIPVLLEVLLVHVTLAADFSEQVVGIIDGDTIEVLQPSP